MKDGAQQRSPEPFSCMIPVAVGVIAGALLALAAVQQAAAQPPPSTPDQSQSQSQAPAPAQPAAAEQNQPVPSSSGSVENAQGNVQVGPETYSRDETLAAAEKFFGGTTEGLAKVIEKAFKDNGRPNAYIAGNEGSGAFLVGLRYGEGTLYYKGGGSLKVYWQGPSVGWDFGGNASKVFTLVYNLHWTKDVFQRFPGVDGSLYFIAGIGLNYQRAADITLAPIRTGVGLRAGANVGYLSYTRKKSWNPF